MRRYKSSKRTERADGRIEDRLNSRIDTAKEDVEDAQLEIEEGGKKDKAFFFKWR